MPPRLELRSAQTALFAQLDLSNKMRVGNSLQAGMPQVLDGDPMILPTLPGAPEELPQIILRSKDGSTQCTVSSARVDFQVTIKPEAQVDSTVAIRQHFDKSSDVHSLILALDSQVRRLGLVVQYEALLDEDAIAFIRRGYFTPAVRAGSREVHLSLLDRETWGNIEINRWITVRTGTQPEVLRVGSDINTVPEAEYAIREGELRQFYERSLEFLTVQLPLLVFLEKS